MIHGLSVLLQILGAETMVLYSWGQKFHDHERHKQPVALIRYRLEVTLVENKFSFCGFDPTANIRAVGFVYDSCDPETFALHCAWKPLTQH